VPCNAIAVVRAKIEAKYVEELLASEPGLRALAKALVPLLGREPSLVVSQGQACLTVQDGQYQGALIVLDQRGLRIEARYMGYQKQQDLTKAVAEIAQRLAIPLAQERVVQGLKDRYGQYAVTDQRVGQNRVVKLRLTL
jgi:hypothetical protein